MMEPRELERQKQRVLEGYELTREEALSLMDAALLPLCRAADEIRAHFCGNAFDLCTIVNGKSGRCSEDCKYCAQSARYPAPIQAYPLLEETAILEDMRRQRAQGVGRYSVVTSGRALSDAELKTLLETYRKMAEEGGVSLCASHGLLTYEQLLRLKEAGVTRYHNNLETAPGRFHKICTTHSASDKIETIQNAQKAGLTVCSGGIMGLGETMEDRIDLALALRDLGVGSVPINILNPIKGTPYEGVPPLSLPEVRRIVAIFRFLLPSAALRLAGGRGLLEDLGKSVFRSGANAAITGDMLTTRGVTTAWDFEMIQALGFEVRPI